VISSNRCGDFTGTPLTAVLDTSTSVRVWNDRTLNLSPNPTRGDIFLRLSGDWTGETFTVHLLSATGQRLRTWRDVRAPGGQFSVGDLPPGVYFLRVAGHTGQLTERLLLLR
jgi:hypothetical protein